MNLYGIIGNPLTHSFSKKYFSNKFDQEDLNTFAYQEFEIPSIKDLHQLIDTLPDLKGFNVTVPYKEEIIDYLDHIDPIAQGIGAVNVVKIIDQKLFGYNSDYLGFDQSFKISYSDYKSAIILGSGGATKAIEYVLRNNNVQYKIVSRNPKDLNQIAYHELNNYIENEQIIINATPVGMYPKINAKPDFPYHLLNDSFYVIDLIYNPEETEFLRMAKKFGAKCKNGYEMLLKQAEVSWDIWQKKDLHL
jgi:shikimate dehydrogenase